MFDHSHRSVKDFLLGLAIGGSLGALMFNTKKGQQVQKDIMKKYHMMSRKAHHFLHDGFDKLTGHSSPKTKRAVKRNLKKKKR